MRKRSRRVSRLIYVSALVAGLLTLGVGSANANFGPCTGPGQNPCYAESGYQIWDYQLGPRLRKATEATRTGSYNTTDVDIVLASGDGFNTTFVTDNLPGDSVGVYECWTYVGQGECREAIITYDGPAIGSWSDASLKALACHEAGHSFGLRHPGATNHTIYHCMNQGYPKPNTLGGHNVMHLDGKY